MALRLLRVVVRLAWSDMPAGTSTGEAVVRGAVSDVRLREGVLRAVLRVLLRVLLLLLLLVGVVGRLLLLVALVMGLLLLLLGVGVLGRSAVAVR